MEISVLGCGRWGSFIAWYLSKNHKTVLWGREGSANINTILTSRSNGTLSFGENTTVTTNLDLALQNDTVVISIASQQLGDFAKMLSERICDSREKRFILCMKGLEEKSGRRLTEIFDTAYTKPHKTAVWVGPGHAEDFVKGIPNCMVIDSADEGLKETLAKELSSPLIRFYVGCDLIGSEVGAASKNVVGIAAGMLDGLGLSSLKGALMARGAGEISRLIAAMGGDRMSAFGLCHLGDYEATVFSPHSHNRAYGEAFVKGEPFDKLAEGVATCRAMRVLQEKYATELPICTAVYRILFENANTKETLDTLFSRQIKNEF